MCPLVGVEVCIGLPHFCFLGQAGTPKFFNPVLPQMLRYLYKYYKFAPERLFGLTLIVLGVAILIIMALVLWNNPELLNFKNNLTEEQKEELEWLRYMDIGDPAPALLNRVTVECSSPWVKPMENARGKETPQYFRRAAGAFSQRCRGLIF